MRPGFIRQVAAIAGGLALVAACSTSSPSAPASPGAHHAASAVAGTEPGPGGPVTLAGYYAQRLRWRPCDSGFQCARLLVPFDYARPAWRRFSLPVIMLPATDAKDRTGSLVVNPGGPGGSGVQYALQARSVIAPAVLDRFNVVGFDPRGVGGSEPAVHCMTGPQLDTYYATDDTPADAAQLADVVAQSKLFAHECQANAGALLPYVGTENAARDLDVLRAALGEAKLTYLGKSYGTFLGAWYAQLFPHRIRALVLDGALDPDATAADINLVQGEGFEVALRSFTANCMASAGCPLGRGSDVSVGIAKLQGLLNRTATTPLSDNLGTRQPASSPMLMQGVVASLYSKSYWPTLRTALQEAFSGDGTTLVELADLLMERQPDGTYSNLADANMAVNCIDRPWPQSLSSWRSAAATAGRAAPQFGAAIVWGSLPCAYWPVPSSPVPDITAAGAPPILVVGTTRDPATPYRWAQALARELRSGVLLGWNGDGHTAYMMGSSCVDNAVNNYLINGVIPRSGTVCPPVSGG
ncbi:MAG TPA: alpha/beta hydrolase [Streptosporangiaceae bacterium]